VDAYALSVQLARLRAYPEARIEGATGALGLDPGGRVERELRWARFEEGRPVLLDGALERPTAPGNAPGARSTMDSGGQGPEASGAGPQTLSPGGGGAAAPAPEPDALPRRGAGADGARATGLDAR
jgi:hypothetical protein